MGLQQLPIETLQAIALYIDDDDDLASFGRVCYQTAAAVNSERHSLWKQRFKQVFDPPVDWDATNAALNKEVYTIRRKVLRTGANFCSSRSHKKINACLVVLANLINDSLYLVTNEEDLEGMPTSRNLEIVKQFARDSNMLRDIFRSKPADLHYRVNEKLLNTVRVSLAHLIFDEKVAGSYAYSFHISQAITYGSPTLYPLFYGEHELEVNTEWTLHAINFFKYHIVQRDNGTLYAPFNELRLSERPYGWVNSVATGSRKHNGLGRFWKGTYAYLERDEVEDLRYEGFPASKLFDTAAGEIFQDKNVDNAEPLQTMTLEFPEDPFEGWLPEFEEQLHSVGYLEEAAKFYASHPERWGRETWGFQRFLGKGWDDEDFLVDGFVSNTPEQNGIRGFKRVSMMKYFKCPDGTLDPAFWAYEGVLLPGNQIMIGRWWCPDADDVQLDTYSGPWIFWQCDEDMVRCGREQDLFNEDIDRARPTPLKEMGSTYKLPSELSLKKDLLISDLAPISTTSSRALRSNRPGGKKFKIKARPTAVLNVDTSPSEPAVSYDYPGGISLPRTPDKFSSPATPSEVSSSSPFAIFSSPGISDCSSATSAGDLLEPSTPFQGGPYNPNARGFRSRYGPRSPGLPVDVPMSSNELDVNDARLDDLLRRWQDYPYPLLREPETSQAGGIFSSPYRHLCDLRDGGEYNLNDNLLTGKDSCMVISEPIHQGINGLQPASMLKKRTYNVFMEDDMVLDPSIDLEHSSTR